MKITADKGAQSHEPPKAALWGLASTYGAAIRVVWESRTVRFRSENPQGFGIDERRFRVSLFIAFFYCAAHLLLFYYKILSADMFP